MKAFELHDEAQHSGGRIERSYLVGPGWLVAVAACLLHVDLSAIAGDAALSSVPARSAELRVELPKSGPVLWFGTFGSPDDARMIPLNVRSYADAAAQAKFKYAVIMAKGEPGFCVWNDKQYDYSLGAAARDYLKEFVEACKAKGIVPGVFYSVSDGHYEGQGRLKGPVGVPYFGLIKRQVSELLTLYPGFRFLAIHGAARFSEAQWTELCHAISQTSPDCLLLCEPSAAANDPKVLPFDWTKGTAALEWREGTSAESLYQSYAGHLAAGRASFLMIFPDKKSGGVHEKKAAVLQQLRDVIVRNAPPPQAQVQEGKKTPAERLKHLQELLDSGMITKAFYEQKKKEILDAL